MSPETSSFDEINDYDTKSDSDYSEARDNDHSEARDSEESRSTSWDWSGDFIDFNENTDGQRERKRKRPSTGNTTATRRPNKQREDRDSRSDNELEEGGGGKRPHKQSHGSQGSKSYGCPYYKLDPENHRKCEPCAFPAAEPRRVK